MTTIKQEMNTRRPAQGASGIGDSSIESGDWRAQMDVDTRQRIINKIMDALKRRAIYSSAKELHESMEKAMVFEEWIYMAATSQSDYLRKMSMKILSFGNRSLNPMPDTKQLKSEDNSVNPPDLGYQEMQYMNNHGQIFPIHVPSNQTQPIQQQMMSPYMHNNIGSSATRGSLDSTSQMVNPNGVNGQKEVYQKVRINTHQNCACTYCGDDKTVVQKSSDWRVELQADSRRKIVNMIMDTYKRHIPFSGEEEQKLKKKAARFEDESYTAATSQSDYLQKISLEILNMEIKSENPMPFIMQSNFAAKSVNFPDPVPQWIGSEVMRQLNNQGQHLFKQGAVAATLHNDIKPFPQNSASSIPQGLNNDMKSYQQLYGGSLQQNVTSGPQQVNIYPMSLQQNFAESGYWWT